MREKKELEEKSGVGSVGVDGRRWSGERKWDRRGSRRKWVQRELMRK